MTGWKSYIKEDAKVLLALSGGADSMYLLYLLLAHREKVPFHLEAAHLHHGLRKEADRDLDFVVNICHKLGVAIHTKHVDVETLARENKMGIEEAGRLARYDFFRSLNPPGGLIALAHHLDDQVETMLLRLIRGTGLLGIGGMEVLEGDLFRPLLHIKKEEILERVHRLNIPYVEDKTNYEATYSRNRVRLNIVPEAKEINPGFIDVMAQFAQMAKDDEAYLKDVARAEMLRLMKKEGDGMYMASSAFRLPKSIRHRVYRAFIEEIRGDLKNIGYEHIATIDALEEMETGKGIDLPDLRIERVYDGIYFALPTNKKPPQGVKLSNKEAVFNGHRFYISETGADDFIYIKDPTKIIIRTRQPGDRIKLDFGHKKVKDLFIDEKIERHKRDLWPIVVEDGEIIWVVGLRKSDRQEEDNWQKLAWHPLQKM